MPYWGKRRSACCLVTAGLSVIASCQALAAASPFDGSYSGAATVTYGSVPVCGPGGDASVTVADGQIDYHFGAFPLKIDVAPDGTFSGVAQKGGLHGARQTMHVRGRITAPRLQAHFNVYDVNGHVCSYHWSLKKA